VRRVVHIDEGQRLARGGGDLRRHELEAGDFHVAFGRPGHGLRTGEGVRQLGERDHEVLLGVRQVAGEAGLVVGVALGIGQALGGEHGVLPFAVARPAGGIVGAPAGALLHHRVAGDLVFDEAAIGSLERDPLFVLVNAPLHQRNHRAAGDRLAFAHRVDDRGLGVELAVLLAVRAVERLVELALQVVGGKLDFLGPRDRRRGDQQHRYKQGLHLSLPWFHNHAAPRTPLESPWTLRTNRVATWSENTLRPQ